MGLKLFKPNQKKSGHACHFQVVSAGPAKGVYLEMIKQTGWNKDSKIGSFKGGDKIKMKFNEFEVSAMIDSIESGREASFFHKSDATGSTIISFKKYVTPSGEHKGHSLAVRRNNVSYLIGLNHGEALAVMEWLKFALHRIYTGLHAEDKKNRAKKDG